MVSPFENLNSNLRECRGDGVLQHRDAAKIRSEDDHFLTRINVPDRMQSTHYLTCLALFSARKLSEQFSDTATLLRQSQRDEQFSGNLFVVGSRLTVMTAKQFIIFTLLKALQKLEAVVSEQAFHLCLVDIAICQVIHLP